jgi:hypothetical protein
MANRSQGAADASRRSCGSAPLPGEVPRALTREVVAEALTLSAPTARRPEHARPRHPPWRGPRRAVLARAARSSSLIWSTGKAGSPPNRRTPAWAEQVKVFAHRLRAVLKTILASPGCSRHATPSGRTPSPWLRRSHRCRPHRPSSRPPGVYPDLRLHPRLRAQRHHHQRAARPYTATRRQLTPSSVMPADARPGALGGTSGPTPRQRFTASLDTSSASKQRGAEAAANRAADQDQPRPGEAAPASCRVTASHGF